MAKIKNQNLIIVGGKEPVLQEKSVEIIENTITTITADEGFDGLKEVEVTTNIASSGGGGNEQVVGLLQGNLTGEFTIPEEVRNIKAYALYNQGNITKLNIPKNVTDIGKYAFYSMYSLKEIYYNASVPLTAIGSTDYPFYDVCRSQDNPKFIIGKDATYIPDYLLGVKSKAYKPQITRIYNEPRTLFLNIGQRQGMGNGTEFNDYLRKLWLDDFGAESLTLGTYAFGYCTALTKVYLNMRAIRDSSSSAFASSGGSTVGMVIKFGEAVNSIGNSAFWSSHMRNIFVGSNVTNIGTNTFNSTSTVLPAITINCITPPTIQSNTFTTSEAPIYIPKGTISAYQSATNWSAFASRLVELEYTNYTDGENTLTLGNNLWFDMTIGGVAYNGTYTLTNGALTLELFDKELDATYTGTIADGVASVTIDGTTYTLTLEA